MSRVDGGLVRTPFIALVDRANRALQVDMVRQAVDDGYDEIRPAHNLVFGTLYSEGSRASDMAARAGITKQSMGEVVRDLVDLGILEMRPDPEDGRAKLVTYTEYGETVIGGGRRHLAELEDRFERAFGADMYAAAREVLSRMAEVLAGETDGEQPVPQ